MAGNTIVVTEKFLDILPNGTRMYAINGRAEGDGSSAAIAIECSRLKRIIGTPAVSITEDDQVAPCFILNTTVATNIITVTASAVVENGKYVTISALVFGD